jgi:hypothetical protein
VTNWIDGAERPGSLGAFEKLAPATGEPISSVARSAAEDVDAAVSAAAAAQPAWAARTVEERGRALRRITQLLERDREEIAAIVAEETGKSPKDARGETDGAIELGYFMAGEGRRYYGRTLPSGTPNRYAQTIRQPLGVAGLIIAANTPIANVAWKVFPALVCGNAAVLKASEDSPETANAFMARAVEAGLPPGVLNIVHGFGEEAGQPLVEDPRVALVSFTGSTAVGRMIARVAGERLAKICLELGGKNPLVVCDDANLEKAAEAAALSAWSNAGQRCAAGSRIVVFDRSTTASASSLSSGPRPRGSARPTTTTSGRSSTNGSSIRCSRLWRGRATPGPPSSPAERGSIRPGFFIAPDDRRGRRRRLRDLHDRAVRADHHAAPGSGLRGGARGRECVAVRPDGGDLDELDPPWAGVRQARPGGRRAGERADVRVRAARSLRRRERLWDRLARARHGGARCLL